MGYYHANEHATLRVASKKPSDTALAVANTIHHNEPRACLLLVGRDVYICVILCVRAREGGRARMFEFDLDCVFTTNKFGPKKMM